MSKELRCKQSTLNKYLEKLGLEYSGNQSGKGESRKYVPAMEYIKNKRAICSHKLKIKLIKDGLKKEKCEICGLSEWIGHKIPLELHHKDGDHYNNALENLIVLCPNCHALQPGNSGANKNRWASAGTGRQF